MPMVVSAMRGYLPVVDMRDSTSLLFHGWGSPHSGFYTVPQPHCPHMEDLYHIISHLSSSCTLMGKKMRATPTKVKELAALSACYLYIRHLRTCRDGTGATSGVEPEVHDSKPRYATEHGALQNGEALHHASPLCRSARWRSRITDALILRQPTHSLLKPRARRWV